MLDWLFVHKKGWGISRAPRGELSGIGRKMCFYIWQTLSVVALSNICQVRHGERRAVVVRNIMIWKHFETNHCKIQCWMYCLGGKYVVLLYQWYFLQRLCDEIKSNAPSGTMYLIWWQSHFLGKAHACRVNKIVHKVTLLVFIPFMIKTIKCTQSSE